MKILAEYDSIKSPKYKNKELKYWENIYAVLIKIKPVMKSDSEFVNLVNAVSQIISKKSRPENKWSNTSERGINKAIPPVVKKKGHKVEFPFQWNDVRSGHECFINNGYWSAKNYMLMDVLGYFLLLNKGNDTVPKVASELFKDLDSIKRREGEFNCKQEDQPLHTEHLRLTETGIKALTGNKHWIRFDDKLFRKFTGKPMGSGDILKLIHETSQVEFKLVYPVRLKDNKKSPKEKLYSMNMFSRFFEFGYIDKQIRGSDGAILSREYFVSFNTILGELLVHNLMSMNYDWINTNFYNLSNYAQIFYRKFLLHHNYKRLQINLETIVNKIQFDDKNITNLINTIENSILKSLQEFGFISEYQKEGGLYGTKYIIYQSDKNSKNNEKCEGL